MADPPSSSAPSDSAPPPRNTPTHNSLRRRGLSARATTLLEEPSNEWPQRRNSTLSDSLSEARHSIRSSTDNLFLPRVAHDREEPESTEESHWHSAPLVLALLPAIAGVFFQGGSSFVTDVTLILLAGIFLNWSVRLPWDWYRSAQGIQRDQDGLGPVEEEIPDPDENEAEARESRAGQGHERHVQSAAELKAIKELQIHELVALGACFVCPIVGTWLLHAIRSSLSRPSEGLVSNYNLTIFLLASEIRPFAHLLKLGQARTLHLQRVVASTHEKEVSSATFQDLTKRLDELEAHVAEAAAARLNAKSPTKAEVTPDLIAQMVLEARHALGPDIDALNRAVRRYEKRTTLTALQTDTRFQELEAQTRDAIALAAAAQRANSHRRQSYAFTLVDWACACIVVPAQLAISICQIPGRITHRCIQAAQQMFGSRRTIPSSRSTYKSKGKTTPGPSYGRQTMPAKSTGVPSSKNSPLQQQTFESAWGAAR
ncbi:hypothetical protein N7539_000247 [Penicillium diatomitis]|uniref:Uncharacterized protein n=1 Tax=Penicillium diatomitis TaxID=2819901 RepID=A0A9X0C254_9EURO|nr:uncharacterized protein N7539_000247 [Penicillium diatomitis]KAJ5495131.1 hypothetical protein N7539_000247 [Penicillium diatomitis]